MNTTSYKHTELTNKYEIDNIIRTTLEEMFPKGYKLPFYANDTKFGTGHTYKFIRSSLYNRIWPTVLRKLHSLGMKEWKMSNPMDCSDREFVTTAKWMGIRSARLPRNRK